MREIARKLKISIHAVHYSLKRKEATGSNGDRKRSGRPKTTSPAEDKYIRVSSLRNRCLTCPQITADLNNTREMPVCSSTVRRRLCGAGLMGRVASRKPLLKEKNRKKRLAWAKKHKDWSLEQWQKVLWSDESKFEVFGSKRRTYVRRRKGEKMLPQCIKPTVKHGGGNVMVWGCFGAGKVGSLHRVEGILNQHGYHSILQRKAIPSGKRLIGEGFVFQQDNDPKHTSRLCRDYLKKKEEKQVLEIMDWPPQSPDLNPIELLWEELDRKVRKTCPTSETHLWEILQKAWQGISSDSLNKLTNRMPRVCRAVIAVKGGFFDEKAV